MLKSRIKTATPKIVPHEPFPADQQVDTIFQAQNAELQTKSEAYVREIGILTADLESVRQDNEHLVQTLLNEYTYHSLRADELKSNLFHYGVTVS